MALGESLPSSAQHMAHPRDCVFGMQVVDPRSGFATRSTFEEHRDFLYSMTVEGSCTPYKPCGWRGLQASDRGGALCVAWPLCRWAHSERGWGRHAASPRHFPRQFASMHHTLLSADPPSPMMQAHSSGKLLYGLGANQAAVRCIAATRSHMIAAGDDGNAVVYAFEG